LHRELPARVSRAGGIGQQSNPVDERRLLLAGLNNFKTLEKCSFQLRKKLFFVLQKIKKQYDSLTIVLS
jgi:hypothetical protein